jgi:hypothetical protein
MISALILTTALTTYFGVAMWSLWCVSDVHGSGGWRRILWLVTGYISLSTSTFALVASMATAWGQNGPPLKLDGCPGDQIRVWHLDASECKQPTTLSVTSSYTHADINRLRKVEWKLLNSDAMTPWQAKMLIEARVQTDIAAGISPETLEAEGK